MSQSGRGQAALHRSVGLVDPALPEYAASLSAANDVNTSRRLINVRKILDTTGRRNAT
jgi:hypothetical protein